MGIAEIFKLNQNTVEILPITMFSERDHKGLIVKFLISTTEWNGTELMNKLQEDNVGHLAVVIAESWALDVSMLRLYDLKELLALKMDDPDDVVIQTSDNRFDGATDSPVFRGRTDDAVLAETEMVAAAAFENQSVVRAGQNSTEFLPTTNEQAEGGGVTV